MNSMPSEVSERVAYIEHTLQFWLEFVDDDEIADFTAIILANINEKGIDELFNLINDFDAEDIRNSRGEKSDTIYNYGGTNGD
mgnify:CR=1 FL=1|tara:strand:- start:913 stop:1161 length:249 start_codon:yes stop_codon:yes gene_type:complete